MHDEIAIESVHFDNSIYPTVSLEDGIDAVFSFSPDCLLVHEVRAHLDNDGPPTEGKMDVGERLNYILSSSSSSSFCVVCCVCVESLVEHLVNQKI